MFVAGSDRIPAGREERPGEPEEGPGETDQNAGICSEAGEVSRKHSHNIPMAGSILIIQT